LTENSARTSVWSRVGARTRNLLASGLRSLSPPLATGYYEELEELLISADVGPATAARLTAAVRRRGPRTREEGAEALVAAAGEMMSTRPRELFFPLPTGERAKETGEVSPLPIGEQSIKPNLDAPARRARERGVNVILLYGVNGAGKTTTAGKLAYRLKQQGHRPMVVAADTYRAAGIEQMAAWADRAGAAHFAGRSGADPASVVFDGIEAARSRSNDVVIVDTAGRLQTQKNLLEELAKVGRVASRALGGASFESLLVLDAVLGLTSLVQARTFNQAIPISGLVLAKLDSSAKGGSVIAVESELGVPAKLAGVGEGIEDLVPFEPEAFVRALFED
jgi:fused signal recognition particle receptor